MEILNFEMRNFFPDTNTNYRAFATGGDKTHSCWIANFVPFDKVTDIYLFESAIDAMSFYEINHFTKETTSAFISTGGYVTITQIESINKLFPHNKIKWNCCYDNDGPGKGYDVATAYFLKGEECKAYANLLPGDIHKTVYICFSNGNTLTFAENDFSSKEFLKQRGISNINIIKPPKYKDWNELLGYYKKFDMNLGPGMKFLPAIEKTTKQLNLRGYHQFADSLNNSGKEMIDSFLQQKTFTLSAPLVENNAYTLMVDSRLFMGMDTLVPIPTNMFIIDKTSQQVHQAYSMNEFFQTEGINIFKDLSSSDFKNILENNVLTITKGNNERKFVRTISPSGWSLKSAPTKNKSLDLDNSI